MPSPINPNLFDIGHKGSVSKMTSNIPDDVIEVKGKLADGNVPNNGKEFGGEKFEFIISPGKRHNQILYLTVELYGEEVLDANLKMSYKNSKHKYPATLTELDHAISLLKVELDSDFFINTTNPKTRDPLRFRGDQLLDVLDIKRGTKRSDQFGR